DAGPSTVVVLAGDRSCQAVPQAGGPTSVKQGERARRVTHADHGGRRQRGARPVVEPAPFFFLGSSLGPARLWFLGMELLAPPRRQSPTGDPENGEHEPKGHATIEPWPEGIPACWCRDMLHREALFVAHQAI